MKVSLLVVTARYGGMDILQANLRRQVQRPHEVILVDALYEERREAVATYLKGSGIVHVPDPPKTRYCNIEAALNVGLAHCRGDLIVFLQDYVWIPRHGIRRFVEAQKNGPCLVSGVGNVGSEPAEPVDSSGLISIFGRDYADMPEGVSWADPRITPEHGLVPCAPVDWELNWACAPREAIEAIGGFDETYGDGWAWGNVDFAYRATHIGYKTYLDNANRCVAFPHDEYFGHPMKKDKPKNNANRCAADLEALRLSTRSARVPYLEERKRWRRSQP